MSPTARYYYTAYGFSLDSDLALPELHPCLKHEGGDIRICVGNVREIPPDAVSLAPGQWSHGHDIWLTFDGVCRLQVSAGCEMIVAPEDNVEERVLRLFILGVGLGLILHQRGFLALHASAASVHGRAVAFLGASGAGKSTMLASLTSRGHVMMADDIIGVDLQEGKSPHVFAAFPQVKLFPEVVSALGRDPSVMTVLHPEHQKLGVRFTDLAGEISLPLARVYLLAEADAPSITPLKPQDALIELIRHTYVAGVLQPTGAAARHMQQCAALVRTVPVRQLERPFDLNTLQQVALLVEKDSTESDV